MPGRLAVCVALLLAGTLAVPGPAYGAVATSGSFVLPDRTQNLTGWVTVLPGRSAHYLTTADSYISYWAEVEGLGTVAGGDGGGIRGCVASDHEFRFRLGWANGDVVRMPAANVTFEIALEFGTAGCDDIVEVARARSQGNQGNQFVPWPEGTLLTGAMVYLGALGVSGLVVWVVLSRRKRRGRPNTSGLPQSTQEIPPARR